MEVLFADPGGSSALNRPDRVAGQQRPDGRAVRLSGLAPEQSGSIGAVTDDVAARAALAVERTPGPAWRELLRSTRVGTGSRPSARTWLAAACVLSSLGAAGFLLQVSRSDLRSAPAIEDGPAGVGARIAVPPSDFPSARPGMPGRAPESPDAMTSGRRVPAPGVRTPGANSGSGPPARAQKQPPASTPRAAEARARGSTRSPAKRAAAAGAEGVAPTSSRATLNGSSSRPAENTPTTPGAALKPGGAQQDGPLLPSAELPRAASAPAAPTAERPAAAATGSAAEPRAVVSAPDTAPDTASPNGETPADRQAIDRLLVAYERAFDSRSVPAIAEVWPSLDARRFSRAFGSIREQDLSFDECAVRVERERAVARCPGRVRYVQRVGGADAQTHQGVWTLTFSKVGEQWRVQDLSVR